MVKSFQCREGPCTIPFFNNSDPTTLLYFIKNCLAPGVIARKELQIRALSLSHLISSLPIQVVTSQVSLDRSPMRHRTRIERGSLQDHIGSALVH
jgi:hypothetical protein